MKRRTYRFTARVLTVVFAIGLLPLPISAVENPTPGNVTDTQADGTRASNTALPQANPNPASYPAGQYPGGNGTAMPIMMPPSPPSKIPTLIGAAFGGLLGANFGIIGTVAGVAVGGFVGHYIGARQNQQPYGNYQDNYNNRLDQYYSQYYGQQGQAQARLGILPGIAGGVFGALIGSQIGGTLGLIVGGIAGYLVGNAFARVLFPQQYYQNQMYGGNFPHDSFRTLPTAFQNPNPVNGYPTYGGNGASQYYPYGNPGASLNGVQGPISPGNLAELRQNFYKATDNYQEVLKGGDQAQKLKSRQSFEAARDAYFNQKGQMNP